MYSADIQNRSDYVKHGGDEHSTNTCPTDVTSFNELKCVDPYPRWENYMSKPHNRFVTKDPWANYFWRPRSICKSGEAWLFHHLSAGVLWGSSILLFFRKGAIHPKMSKLATDNFVAELLIITKRRTFCSILLSSLQYLSPHRKALARDWFCAVIDLDEGQGEIRATVLQRLSIRDLTHS